MGMNFAVNVSSHPEKRGTVAAESLQRLTVKELRAVAKLSGIRIPVGSRKADIIEIIRGANAG